MIKKISLAALMAVSLGGCTVHTHSYHAPRVYHHPAYVPPPRVVYVPPPRPVYVPPPRVYHHHHYHHPRRW